MSYDYQTDDMDALRVTFEGMLEDIQAMEVEIAMLQEEHDNEMFEADEAIVKLYNEANDLEAEVHALEDHIERLRAEYDQVIFDQQEDYIDLQQEYNALARDFNELFDEMSWEAHNGLSLFDELEDEDQWELFHATGISIN